MFKLCFRFIAGFLFLMMAGFTLFVAIELFAHQQVSINEYNPATNLSELIFVIIVFAVAIITTVSGLFSLLNGIIRKATDRFF